MSRRAPGSRLSGTGSRQHYHPRGWNDWQPRWAGLGQGARPGRLRGAGAGAAGCRGWRLGPAPPPGLGERGGAGRGGSERRRSHFLAVGPRGGRAAAAGPSAGRVAAGRPPGLGGGEGTGRGRALAGAGRHRGGGFRIRVCGRLEMGQGRVRGGGTPGWAPRRRVRALLPPPAAPVSPPPLGLSRLGAAVTSPADARCVSAGGGFPLPAIAVGDAPLEGRGAGGLCWGGLDTCIFSVSFSAGS